MVATMVLRDKVFEVRDRKLRIGSALVGSGSGTLTRCGSRYRRAT